MKKFLKAVSLVTLLSAPASAFAWSSWIDTGPQAAATSADVWLYLQQLLAQLL